MVNINNVYQSVLVITNKDNRGYITPEEFNRLAEQAQNEIFASYFVREAGYELNAFLTSDFSDPNTYLAEKINVFYKDATLTHANGEFTYPSDLYRVGVVSVDNSNIGNGSPGGVTNAIRKKYLEIVNGNDANSDTYLTLVK